MNPPTPQLAAWQGAFGNAYIDRNPASDAIIALRAQGFARMLAPLCGRAPNSVLEIGANIGLNLRALQRLGMGGLQAVEPNPRARAQLIADRVLPTSQVFDACAEALPSALFPLNRSLTGEGVRTRLDGERPERRPRLVSHPGLMP